MPILGFIQPPGLPILPPATPPGVGGGLASGLVTGAAGRLATRFPGAALLIGGALVVGWVLANWRQPPTQSPPAGGFPPGTSWDYRTGYGTSWMARIGYLYTDGNGTRWQYNNAYLEVDSDGIKRPVDWYSVGPRQISISGVTKQDHPSSAALGYALIVTMNVLDVLGAGRTILMVDNYSTAHKIDVYPIGDHGPEGVPGTPLIPAPYLPPPLNPEEEERKRRDRPAAPPPLPATPKPLKPAQPKRTDPTPGPGDPAREQPPAQPPATPRPAAPPGLDEQIPGLRRELGAIRDALAKATSGQGAGGQGTDPQGAKKGAATWAPTQPNGAPAPQPAPAPAKATDPTQHLTKAGPVTAPDVRPDLPGIAQEVGRIERKLVKMMGPDGSDLGALIDLLRVIYDLLTNHVDGTSYTVTAACTTAGETEPRSATVTVPGGLTREEAAIARLDAIAELMAETQLLKQASCSGRNTTSPTNNVTVTAYEVIKE